MLIFKDKSDQIENATQKGKILGYNPNFNGQKWSN